MLRRSLLPQLLLILMQSGVIQPSHAIVYTLIPDTGLTDGYGYSGTVTTDGSLGTFVDESPITDFNITMLTPGGVDGVTSQALSPPAIPIFLSMVGVGFLELTPTAMSILNSDTNQTTNLFFNFGTGEGVVFEGPIAGGQHGFASVTDSSEDPSFSSFFIGDGVSAAFAVVVPEPNALCLGLLAVGVFCVARGSSRRKC